MQSSIKKLKNLENNFKNVVQKHRETVQGFRDDLNNIKKEINQLPYHKIEQWIMNNQSESLESYQDSLSHGQLTSKEWMVEKLPKGNDMYIEIIADNSPVVLGYTESSLYLEIIGGWFGCPLIDLLNTKLNIKKIDFYEKDDSCKKILAQYLNHFNFNFEVSVFGDFFERKELRRRDLIINTSSEHMRDITEMKKYFKGNPALAIQSNNYFEIDDHINCVNDVDELIIKNQIKNVWYKGDLEFEKYTRFMAIGQWYD